MLTVTVVMLASCSPVVEIRNNYGGEIDLFYDWRLRLEETPVRIGGHCHSACTMLLTLPLACVEPTAILGFHGASPDKGNYEANLYADMIMGQYYNEELLRRYVEEWRHKRGRGNITVLTAQEVVKLDPNIKLCE